MTSTLPDFTFETAAIPEELTSGEPLSEAEFCAVVSPGSAAMNSLSVADGVCANPSATTPAFPDKNVWLGALYSMFMHGGLMHLGGNMLYLWVFGNNIEDHLGKVRFVAFYLGAGVVATFAHIAIDTSSTVALIGASGAVAGVMGAYLVWFPNARVRTMVFVLIVLFVRIRAKWLLGLWFASQFLIDPNDGVAWMAHVGGFVVGVVVGLIVRESRRAREALLARNFVHNDR